jgi:hypothetical protein
MQNAKYPSAVGLKTAKRAATPTFGLTLFAARTRPKVPKTPKKHAVSPQKNEHKSALFGRKSALSGHESSLNGHKSAQTSPFPATGAPTLILGNLLPKRDFGPIHHSDPSPGPVTAVTEHLPNFQRTLVANLFTSTISTHQSTIAIQAAARPPD